MTSSQPVALGGRGRNLALSTVAFALCFAAWSMLAPLAPKLQDKLLLSDTETGILVAIPVLLGSILRIPVGRLTDRYGGRIMFTGLIFYTAAATVLVGLASSYVSLLFAAFLLGIAGTSFAIGVPFAAEWYPKQRQGFALGIYGMGNIGTAISAFLVPFIYLRYGQAAVGFVLAAAISVFGVIWYLTARDAPVTKKPPTRYAEILKSGSRLWKLCLFYFVTFGGFVAMAIFLPKLLRDWFDFSLTDAGMRAAGFTVVATIARPIGGALSDRFGARRVLAVAFIGVGFDAIGLSWQATDPSIVPITILCLTMAGFLGLGNGAVFKLVPELFPESTGAATGIVGAAGGLGGFFPPLAMGLVKDATGTYTMGFVFLVAFAWMCAGQALSLREYKSPSHAEHAPPELTTAET